jgi:hypothetical protein
LLEHLSCRLGNQLIFVRIEDVDGEKMSGKIVELNRGDPSITIPELKAEEIIVRMGPAKGGHWLAGKPARRSPVFTPAHYAPRKISAACASA